MKAEKFPLNRENAFFLHFFIVLRKKISLIIRTFAAGKC